MSFSKQSIFCGYADILAHLKCDTVEDIRDYNFIMLDFPSMRIEEDMWHKRKSRLKSYLKNRYVVYGLGTSMLC